MGTKEDIRAKINIADFIGEYVRLSPSHAGKMKGLCPFHKEKTPSFTVDSERGLYYCFGCKEGGDVFKFLGRVENLSFADTLRKLAERTGVTLDQQYSDKKINRDVFEVNEFALKFYCSELHKPEGMAAAAYLGARGLTAQTLAHFELGFAPNQWDALLKHAKTNNITEAQLLQAGLLSENTETGKVYDRFRNRIIYPIRDYLGRLVGFGGRVLDDSKPKYLNTPETEYFKKSDLLYGLNFSRANIQRTHHAILVEGYMDVIAMHQAGFLDAVATLGTALTRDHAALLARQGVRSIAMMFDQDEAGQKATLSGLDQMIGSRFMISAHQIPGGKDPADVLLEGRKHDLEIALMKGLNEVDFRVQHALKQFNVGEQEGKRQFLQHLLPRMHNHDLIDEIAAAIRSKVAEALNIDEQKLLEWVESKAKRKTLSDVQVQGMSKLAREDAEEWLQASYGIRNPRSLRKIIGIIPYKNKDVAKIIEVALVSDNTEQILEHFRGQPQENVVLQLLFENPLSEKEELHHKGFAEAESKRTNKSLQETIAELKTHLMQATPEEHMNILKQITELQRAIEAEKRTRILRARA